MPIYPIYIFLLRLTTTVHAGLFAEKSKLSHLYLLLNAFCNYQTAITILFLVILILFVVFMIVTHKKISISEIMIIGSFVIPYLLMFLISYKLPMTSPRYMIFVTPGLFLTIMMAISYLGCEIKFITIGLSIICIGLMAITANFNYSLGFQSKNAVSIIHEYKSDSTRLFIFPSWIDIVYTYHYNINFFKHYGKYRDDLKKENTFVLSWPNDLDTMNLSKVKDVLFLSGWGAEQRDKDNILIKTLIQKIGPIDTIAVLKSYSIYHFGSGLKNK